MDKNGSTNGHASRTLCGAHDGGTELQVCERRASDAKEIQVGGKHYADMAIQPVVFVHANGLTYLEGNVVKYVSRHRRKNGAEDIRKAIHYLELILQLEYGQDR
jgi:hypothetical protein